MSSCSERIVSTLSLFIRLANFPQNPSHRRPSPSLPSFLASNSPLAIIVENSKCALKRAMSTTRKGNCVKKRQRHQNTWTYKPGLHRTGKRRAQDVASLPLAGVCGRCREKIEWKIKYDKYKPLSAPRKWCVQHYPLFKYWVDHAPSHLSLCLYTVQCAEGTR